MDDSWVILANWVTGGAVIVSLFAVFVSGHERRRPAGQRPVGLTNQGPELLDEDQARALLNTGREFLLRLRTPPEIESLERYDQQGHLKRYDGLYVLYLAPGDEPAGSSAADTL